jgi:hypothetical protein
MRVIESGFTAFSSDGNDFASFAAILENPNDRWAATRMQVTVDFFDSDGAFIAGEEIVVQVVPGQRTAIAGEAFGAGRAERMDVNLPDDTTAFEPGAAGESFVISGLDTTRADGLNVTSGRLTSRFRTEEMLVQLNAVYRNSRGAIIGGAVGGVDAIGPGETTRFEIIDSAPHRDLSRTEVHWQVSGLQR